MPAKTVKRESPYLRVGTTIYKRVRQPLSSGRSVETLIPWIALILLGYIGGKMLLEGIKGEETEEAAELSAGALFMQGVATSIDALSVGFTISEYGWFMALVCSLIIAVVTFFICAAGLSIGKKFGTKLSGKASVLGGVILIGIGLEIFISGIMG